MLFLIWRAKREECTAKSYAASGQSEIEVFAAEWVWNPLGDISVRKENRTKETACPYCMQPERSRLARKQALEGHSGGVFFNPKEKESFEEKVIGPAEDVGSFFVTMLQFWPGKGANWGFFCDNLADSWILLIIRQINFSAFRRRFFRIIERNRRTECGKKWLILYR